MTREPLTETTRELACLALAHDDADEPACSSTDEDLVRQLVEEVQALRVAAGVVAETEVDREERIAAVADAFDDRLPPGLFSDLDRRDHAAEELIAGLADSGWTLYPVRRP